MTRLLFLPVSVSAPAAFAATSSSMMASSLFHIGAGADPDALLLMDTTAAVAMTQAAPSCRAAASMPGGSSKAKASAWW